MLDINFIFQNPKKVKKTCQDKGVKPETVDRVLKVDETRRQLIQEIEKLRSERNRLTKADREKGRKIKETLKKLEPDLRAVEEQFKELLYQIPNVPADDIPIGKNENDNVEIKKWGKIPKFSFKPKDHLELGEALDLIDVKRAAKVSGTRFGYLKNEAVLLELGLVQLALEMLIKEGFVPVVPLVLINLDITKGLGYWQHGGHEDYYLVVERDRKQGETEDFYLVGTAEHSIIPMHKDEILKENDLPRRYVGFSTCFRREAGSYGKDTRGIFRVHQFDKVEMVSFIKPQPQGDKQEHEYLLSLEEKLVQALKIPYQITKMCTGDLGYPAARKYDINCWFPSEKRYRETHSTSTCTDYQARRLNIRYRDKGGKTNFVHTLNGTAFAIGRMILAILENYQQKDGSVLIPEVLQKFVGKKKITSR